MTKLNIGVLTEIVSGTSGARAPLEIAKYLADRGHQVTVYSYNYHKDANMHRYLVDNGVKVITIDKPHLSRFLAIPQLFYKLKENKHDILYFSGTPPFFIAGLLSRIPIVSTYYGTQFDALKDKFFISTNIFSMFLNWVCNLYIQAVEYVILHTANKVVTISKYAKEEVKRLYKMSVPFCYLGTLPSIRQIHKDRSARKKGALTLLSVSRLVPYKGFHLLIPLVNELREKHPQLKLHIVGQVTHHQYFQYLKNFCNSHITIWTNVTDQKLASFYQTADIYVTCDRFLFFGLPILEASSFGLPIVALNHAAATEIVRHGKTGYIANSLTEFSDQVSQLIDSPHLRFTMGRAAKKFAASFTWEKTARTYEKIFYKLL